MRELLRRAWYLIRRRRFDADLHEELEFHRSAIERELERGGTDAAEARFAARRAIGSVALAQDDAHDVWVPRALRGLGQDVRLAFRALRRQPGPMAAAILTLALGIGANAAVFSVIDPLLVRTLPVRHPDRLVLIHAAGTLRTTDMWDRSAIDIYSARTNVDVFDGVIVDAGLEEFETAFRDRRATTHGDVVSPNYFAVLGVRPRAGRMLDQAGPASVVLSFAYWTSAFRGDPAAVGEAMFINGQPHTIAGVAPPDFTGLEVGLAPDFFVPLKSAAANPKSWVKIVGRLRPDITPAQAAVALDPSFHRAVAASGVPDIEREEDMARLLVTPAGRGLSDLRERFADRAWALTGVVFLVLLVASANVATLMLVRASARSRDIAVQFALGATRWRVLRQFGMEIALVAGAGTVAGLIAAQWGSRLLVAWLSTAGTPVTLAADLNGRVLLFTGAILALTIVLCCLGPANALARLAATGSLKSSGSGTEGDPRPSALRRALVIAQIAASVALLSGTGLLLRSLVNLTAFDVGFAPDRVVAVSFSDDVAKRPAGQADEIVARVVEDARRLPGVDATAVASLAPLSGVTIGINVSGVAGVGGFVAATPSYAMFSGVSPGYFEALGVPLLAGRGCEATDGPGTPPVAIVNQRLARRLFAQDDPLTRQIRFVEGTRPPMQVIGVAADATYNDIREEPLAFLYVCRQQTRATTARGVLFVKSSGAHAAALAPAVQRVVQAADGALRLGSVRTLSTDVSNSLRPDRLAAGLFTGFTLLALIIAAIGIYGVIAYSVARRTREFGIRVAIGAQPWDVVRLVLGQSLVSTGAGIVLGLAAAGVLTRYLSGMLFGVTPLDPFTFIAVPLVFALVAAAATYVPARRATKVDPLVALRAE